MEGYVSRGGQEGPDQGYAWVVVLACFCINFLLVGLARSVSAMYVALVETYGVTRQQATLPFSIRVSLRSLAGPLIGLMGQKYGIRKVTAIGGLLASLGSFLCNFAPNVMWITIFWGIIHGIGFGMGTIMHMMMINQYFDKYKATALGLAYAGDCFGTFAFPVILEQLLDHYDVNRTFLILSAIILIAVPISLLLRKPPWQRTPEKYEKDISREIPRESVGYRNEAFLNFDKDLSPFHKNEGEYCDYNVSAYGSLSQSSNRLKQTGKYSRDATPLNGSLRSQRTSMLSSLRNDSLTPVYELDIENSHKESSFASSDIPSMMQTNANQDSGMHDPQQEAFGSANDSSRASFNKGDADQRVGDSSNVIRRRSSAVSQLAHEILHRVRSASFASQVAQDGFIAIVPEREAEKDHDPPKNFEVKYDLNTVTLPINGIFSKTQIGIGHTDRSSSSVAENFRSNDGQELVLSVQQTKLSETGESSSQLPNITQTNQPSLLKLLIQTNTKPIFVLISLSMAVFAYCFVGVITILVDYAGDQGVSHHQAKYLVMAFSVTDLIGRLCFGQIVDRKMMKIKNYASVTMLLMGTMIASLPFNTSFSYMIVLMCLYGSGIGGVAIMFPILVNHYMDRTEEAIAMGCLNFYAGILTLSMAPMIGHFRDSVGSYNGVFHVFGGLVALMGVVWQFEPLILKFQNRPRRKHEDWVMVTKL